MCNGKKNTEDRVIFHNAHIVDVVNLIIYHGWFSVVGKSFEFVEEGDFFADLSGERVDLQGAYVVPGLIDAHMHIESSLLTPPRFAEAAMKWGTCAVLQDPHEMANVFGVPGVEFMIANAESLPLRVYTAIPSCVPPTRPPLESCCGKLTEKDLMKLSSYPNVIALGELMDYRGVLDENQELLAIVQAAKTLGLIIEGHCPTLTGLDLSKYIAIGISSDHTLTNPKKIMEQLRKGMYVMLQPKSLTKYNIKFVMKIKDRSRILLVTDDTTPAELIEGHLNRVVKLAILRGWDPIDAIASATIRPAQYLGLRHLGAIMPGKSASFFITHDIETLTPLAAWIDGMPVPPSVRYRVECPPDFRKGLEIRPLSPSDFRMLPNATSGVFSVNIITANNYDSRTGLSQEEVEFEEGYPNVEGKDLVLVGVFCRGSREPKGTVGLLKGLGLGRGAFCSSFSHDAHNLLIVGKTPHEMAVAANAVIAAGGGLAVSDGHSTFLLELPIGGLLTDEPVTVVAAKEKTLVEYLKTWGLNHERPIQFLTTLTLTTSPYYKITDKGIIDVERRRILPVVEDTER